MSKLSAVVRIALAAFLVCLPFSNVYAYRVGDIELTPFVSAHERYDSNIFSSDTNEQDDWITAITLGIDALSETKDRVIGLTGSITREMFWDLDDNNNTAVDLEARYRQELNKWERIAARNAFTRAEDPRTFEDEFGRTTGRVRYHLNRFNIDYVKDISKQISMTAGYANEIYEREGDGRDSFLNNFNLRGDYAIDSENIVSAVSGFSWREYSPGGSVKIFSLDGGIRRFFTTQLYLDLFAGLSAIDRPAGNNLYKPRYFATLTNEFDEKSKAVLAFSKKFDANYWDEDVFDSWRVSFDVDRRLHERLTGRAGLFYGQGTYVTQNVKDKFHGAQGRLAYDLTPDINAYFSQTYTRTSSDIETRDYSRSISMLGVEMKF